MYFKLLSLPIRFILFVMGNSSGNANRERYKDFQMQKYMNQGLNQNQIIQIKEAFDFC